MSFRRLSLPLVLLALAVLIYAVGFSALTIERYAAFEARSQDMGNLNQAIWNLAHGNGLRFTNYAGITSRLSLHVEPILLLIAPLYRLAPRVETLLIIQAIVVALGAVPLFALARRELGSEWGGLAFGLVFLLNPTVQGANWYEFHPVTLALTLLPAAFFCLITARPGWFALFAVLAAGCKEEIALLIFMLGLYAFLRLGQRRLGLITMALSLGWALFAVLGVQNLVAAGNIHWDRYAYLGDTPARMIQTILTRPGLIWRQLQAANALGYLYLLFLPVAFLPLFGLDLFLLALPSLAINLLADFPPMHEATRLIYAAPIIPFVMPAAIYGAARLQRGLAQRAPRIPAAFAVSGLALAGAVAGQILYGYLPGGGNYLALTVTPHHQRAAEIIDQIAPAAAVSAQDRLNPHVSGRETLYIYPRVEDADTVFIDVTGPAWPQHPSDLRAGVDELLAGDFGVAAGEDGYLLLTRNAESKTLPPELFSAFQTDPPEASAPLARFGDVLDLLQVEAGVDRYGEVVTTLTWQARQPPAEDWRFFIAYLAPDGDVLHDSEFYPPPVALWYPTSIWDPAIPVKMISLPWALEADRFVLAVGVYRGEDWQTGERLTVDAADLPVLEGDTLLRVGGYRRAGNDGWQTIHADDGAPTGALDAQLGPHIRLRAAAVPATAKPGQALPITLQWQTDAPLDFDYTAFVHVLNDAGERVVQLDWQPQDAIGLLPATEWQPGRPVIDRQTITLPPELPPGRYHLLAGLYNWQDGVRLPVTGADATPDDAVSLGAVTIE
ncbi:MAG: DUF2079 domain-containing protein [Caldilineaceae bacterium]|nr:DUF2079 domain-containing protein [Caldilineaceae bacterium]